MKFRLFRLLVPVLAALCHFRARQGEDLAGFYVVQRCQHFAGIPHATLYDFVTQAHLANKWMKFVTFVATDHRPVGAGKTYKAVIEPHIFLLAVVDHRPGDYIALLAESTGGADGLVLRILLRFASAPPEHHRHHHHHHHHRHHPPERKGQFTNRISAAGFAPASLAANGTTGQGYSPGGAAEAEEEVQQCSNNSQHGCRQHCQQQPPGGTSSRLSVQIFFQHKSILFQHTMGPILHLLMQRHLGHSLNNLVHILPHVERYSAMLLPLRN